MDAGTFMLILAWGVFVGIVFSAIGAAGGILTSFGLITLFGVLDPNSVKPMTQLVVLATALVFVPEYLRNRALVLPLGLLLGGGGLIGAFLGSTLSSLYLSDMQSFRPLFGMLTLAIAMQIFWKLARQFAAPIQQNGNVPPGLGGVSDLAINLRAVTFQYAGRAYRVPVWSPLLAGLIIAMTASVFGVGGGFLLVPYMASVLGMPMHIIPATAAIAIFMSLAVSIGNFLRLGAPLDWGLLVPLIVGAVIGALAGPRINKAMKNNWLQVAMALIVGGIGMKYTIF